MTWDPPGLLASILISILGGIAAGVLVLVVEIVIRRGYDRRQRRKAERAICQFFREWETTINEAAGIPSGPGTLPVPKENVQFGKHGDFIRRAANLTARWSRYLAEEQVEDLMNLVEGHQAVIDLIAPRGGVFREIHYENFFSDTREIEWLEF